MDHPNHQLALDFFAALSAGNLPDALLTDDMTAWTTSSNATCDRARYQMGVGLLASVARGGLTYTADTLTAEEDRVAAEVQATGTLSDGQAFANRYVFMLRVRDGRISAVAEHFDPRPVAEKIGPLIQAKLTAAQGQQPSK